MDLGREDVLSIGAEDSEEVSAKETELPPEKPRSTLATRASSSNRVQRLLLTDKTIASLNASRGPTGIGPDGRPLGTLSVDYDFAFVRELVLRGGIKVREELTAGLRGRADDACLYRGEEYIADTVASVLAAVSPIVDDTEVDFTVDRVTVYTSDPPYFELEIDGVVIDLSSRDLLSRGRFRRRFLELCGRVPRLPDDDEGFRRFVDAMLEGAQRIEQPLGRDALRDEVAEIIACLPVSSAHRLDIGDAVLIDGERRAFKLQALLSRLAKRKLRPTPEKLSALLASLGFEYARPRISGRQTRVWVSPPGWDSRDE